MFGILQLLSNPHGALFFYRITNNGSAVGLFSNRNHHAILVATLIPMLAAFASIAIRTEAQAARRRVVAATGAVILIALILNIGSRLGLALGIFGLVSAVVVYRPPQDLAAPKRGIRANGQRYLVAAISLATIVAATVALTRSETVERISSADRTGDIRLQFWGPIARMAAAYFPVGSGLGSFDEVYRIGEPDRMLDFTYLNHAHNDWLELWLTAGVPGLGLAAVALFMFYVWTRQAFARPVDRRRQNLMGRLGAIIVVMLMVGSVTDYPLRTPSLAALLVMALVWLRNGSTAMANSAGDQPATLLGRVGTLGKA